MKARDQEQLGLRRRDTQEGQGGPIGEALFFELALEDLTAAADLFRSVWEATAGVDGGEDEAQLAGRSAR